MEVRWDWNFHRDRSRGKELSCRSGRARNNWWLQ